MTGREHVKDLSRRHWAKETPTARPLFSAGVFTCRIGASPLFQRAASVWFRGACLVSAVFLIGCGRQEAAAPTSPAMQTPIKHSSTALAGSKTCQECHADFYKLWSTSWHGLAMQPYTAAFAKARLTPQKGDITIGKRKYRAEVGEGAGCVREIGPDGDRKYPIVHVMGGKNVYYLLTPLDRGRLQVLPLAYDVHKKAWYDMAASGVRHFPDRRDEALDWTDRMFAFNTTCFNCHVTELSTNYDLATDTYHTTWSEPGISCESCHGSAKEHMRAMEAGAEGQHVERHQDHSHQGVHSRADERHVRHLPCEAGPAVAGVPAGRQVLRSLRPHHPGTCRLLPRRPRPGRELHVHLVADEPVRPVGQAGLQPLPHAQRPNAL